MSNQISILVLRLAIGVCILFHGIAKIYHGLGGIKSLLASNSLPVILAPLVYVGEVLAPLMIIFGIFTRVASGIVLINCVFILYMAYSGSLFSLTKMGGLQAEIVYLYMGILISLMITGGGKYSIKK